MSTYAGQEISTIGQTAMEIAPLTGPGAPFVALGGEIANLVGHLLGPPKTLPQTFLEQVYPYCIGESKLKNLPVFCFWFGDIIVTFPDGSYGVTGNVSTLQAAYDYWSQLSQTDVFEVLECTKGIEDYATGGCHYASYGSLSMLSSATTSVNKIVSTITANPLIIIGVIGGGLLLLWRFK
jgi:hypothetical protein